MNDGNSIQEYTLAFSMEPLFSIGVIAQALQQDTSIVTYLFSNVSPKITIASLRWYSLFNITCEYLFLVIQYSTCDD